MLVACPEEAVGRRAADGPTGAIFAYYARIVQEPTLAAGTIVGGRYRVDRLLGRGGMGAVYVAEHLQTGAQWALKILLGATHLDPDSAERFRREARALGRISSDHVVRVIDADTAPELGGAPFLVMELLRGRDLGALLDERTKLPPAEVVAILVQVGRALDAAHAAHIIHRDLKPENIFLHEPDRGPPVVKLVDFGISKVVGGADGASAVSVTSSNAIMGTPIYMAPEQATARHHDVGPATDVWAVGLMTIRLLTGELYWPQVDSLAEVFAQILCEVREAPSARWPHLPVAFDQWFFKSCSLKREARFQSVGEQIDALADALLGPDAAAASRRTARLSEAPTRGDTPRSTPAPVSKETQRVVALRISAPDGDAASGSEPASIATSTAPGTSRSVPEARSRSRVLAATGLVVAASAVLGAVLTSSGSSSKAASGNASAAGDPLAPTEDAVAEPPSAPATEPAFAASASPVASTKPAPAAPPAIAVTSPPSGSATHADPASPRTRDAAVPSKPAPSASPRPAPELFDTQK